ncbi:MAG: hypothetical protein C5S46_04690 [Candidatus Methanomarinus sp.]|uniref:Uncharacterized protein n=1 Tax=Candidatus Methanomarinus sp. TaxID=3386244 RepID=A0AC61SAF2_9EURY|nr:MAG: hypothetical protein C5S46_04690 [ANME-2 cluster archaeon]
MQGLSHVSQMESKSERGSPVSGAWVTTETSLTMEPCSGCIKRSFTPRFPNPPCTAAILTEKYTAGFKAPLMSCNPAFTKASGR